MANEKENGTVTCTIDDVEVTVPEGTVIIEAAEQAGIGIAHYCYHPALSAPAMCRMCLVEVEGAPKLVPACITPVGDEQVIRTESEKPREMRQGVLEFYLKNHPLDCPICDKSGECKLQDYTAHEGRKHGRSFEAKRVLGQDDFGGDVLYDGDRCIMCTRCVRFMREIAQDDLLCVVQRGSRSVIDTFFESGLHDSPYAGNIIDICPVGALLSKDFHHKARVWDLDRTPSICPNCSQGCNITLDTRDNLVQRLRPRHNPEVNSHWMCDYGRYRYEWMNRGSAGIGGGLLEHGAEGDFKSAGTRGDGDGLRPHRVEAPLMRTDDGALQTAGWHEAVLALLSRMETISGGADGTVVGSPFHANEGAGLLARLAEVLGVADLVYRSARAEDEEVCPGFPKLARRRDLSANGTGLETLGFRRVGDDGGRGGLEDAAGPDGGGVLIVLGDDLADQPADFGRDASLFVYLGESLTAATSNADFVFPITSFAEQEGTFTNFEGRVQIFRAGLQSPALARPAWQVLGVLLAGLDDAPAPASASDAFLRIGELNEAFSGLTYGTIGSRGALLNTRLQVAAGGAGVE